MKRLRWLSQFSCKKGGESVTLDRTIFYPQGGGQPSDKGTIVGSLGQMQVELARFDSDGTVHHFGDLQGELAVGEPVKLHIDGTLRFRNAKLHSAGHLIDIAMQKSGIANSPGIKGYHFPDGPYVEFAGGLESSSQAVEILQNYINILTEKNINITSRFLTSDQSAMRGIIAPPGKEARFVYFDGYEEKGCGCGGTHVSNTSELGQIGH